MTSSRRAPWILLLALAVSLSVQGRTFKDKLGRPLEAEVIAKQGDQIKLKRSDGKEFTISAQTLSPEDQAYVASWQPGGAKPAAAPAPSPDERVKPGATVELTFPDLVTDQNGAAAACNVRIPENYDPAKPLPLLVWIGGGKGSNMPGGGLNLVDKTAFAIAALPYPSDVPPPRDAISAGKIDVIFNYHKPMLAAVRKLLPNVDPKVRIVAGFSNGAHTIGTAIEHGWADYTEFFNAFVIIEGGARTPNAKKKLRDKFAYLAWGTDPAKGSKEYMKAMVGSAKDAKLKVTTSDMVGEGHAFPETEKAKVKEWIETTVLPGLTNAK